LTKGGNEAYNDVDESINLNRYKSLLYLLFKESYGHRILGSTCESREFRFQK